MFFAPKDVKHTKPLIVVTLEPVERLFSQCACLARMFNFNIFDGRRLIIIIIIIFIEITSYKT